MESEWFVPTSVAPMAIFQESITLQICCTCHIYKNVIAPYSLGADFWYCYYWPRRAVFTELNLRWFPRRLLLLCPKALKPDLAFHVDWFETVCSAFNCRPVRTMTEANAFNTRRPIQLAYLTLEAEWWKPCTKDYFMVVLEEELHCTMRCCLEEIARHRSLEEPVW